MNNLSLTRLILDLIKEKLKNVLNLALILLLVSGCKEGAKETTQFEAIPDYYVENPVDDVEEKDPNRFYYIWSNGVEYSCIMNQDHNSDPQIFNPACAKAIENWHPDDGTTFVFKPKENAHPNHTFSCATGYWCSDNGGVYHNGENGMIFGQSSEGDSPNFNVHFDVGPGYELTVTTVLP